MKLKREIEGKCLNCRSQLQIDDHYCPRCGQKVDHNDLSLNAVFSEFFENYLSLDSRLGRTLYPFFFKPGYLASQFMSGVRRNYANPFRLYIFSSLFFFFCLNASVQKDADFDKTPIVFNSSELKGFPDLADGEREYLDKILGSSLIDALNADSITTFSEGIAGLDTKGQKKVLSLMHDSAKTALSINIDSIMAIATTGVNWSSNNEGLNVDFDFGPIEKYRYDPAYTDEMLFDTLNTGEDVPGKFEKLLVLKAIRIHRSDPRSLSKMIFGNLSLAMFVLIPLFALFVKFLYWRRNKYYVAHLIHTMYLQSFAFLLFGFAWFFQLLIGFEDTTMLIILQIMAIVFLVYLVSSFKRVYQQGWFKLLLKSILLVGIYHILAFTVFLGEIFVSILLF